MFWLAAVLALVASNTRAESLTYDCRERPITAEQISKLAADSSDFQDFLNKFPKDSMQAFTFVTNSKSLQRGDDKSGHIVDDMWPRVLRFTADRKIAMSFVCDPQNQAYGTVELLYFDNKGKRIRSTEIDFRNKEQRIHNNPQSCYQCHSGSTFQGETLLKYNWPQYFVWGDCQRKRGITFYGTDDDNFGQSRISKSGRTYNNCSQKDYAKAHSEERAAYQTFLATQRSNPCYGSLPWPDASHPFFANKFFPYEDQDDIPRPEFRPNLTTTRNFSRLTAAQLAKAAKERSPALYDKTKTLVALEAMNCLSKEALGDYASLFFNDSKYVRHSVVLTLLERAGFGNSDLSQEFLPQTSHYNTGDGDLSMGQLVSSAIIEDLTKNDSELQAAIGRFRTGLGRLQAVPSESDTSCQETVVPLQYNIFNPKKSEEICNLLKTRLSTPNLGALDSIRAGVCHIEPNPQPITRIAGAVTDKLNQIERGRLIANGRGKCTECHSFGSQAMLGRNLLFVPKDTAPRSEYEASLGVAAERLRDNLSGRIENRVVRDKTMPPVANDLSDQDRKDIQAYLLSLGR